MIIIQLNGGLGNQFFQYALGRRLSHEHGVPLRFDLSIMQTGWSYRRYTLEDFRTTGQVASKQELKQFHRHENSLALYQHFSLYQSMLPYYRRKVVREKKFTFDPNILRVPANVFLQGYWQSEKYFRPIRQFLLHELTIKEDLDTPNQQMLNIIYATNSVSIHIRRGDYVNDPHINHMHGVLPLAYYQQAMQTLEDTIQSPRYFVFSDDISWAKEHLSEVANIVFVDHNGLDQDYFDFALMTACKHHIIANSSFSWWPAWLGDHPDKIVIAPRHWYQSGQDTRDLIPKEWIRL